VYSGGIEFYPLCCLGCEFDSTLSAARWHGFRKGEIHRILIIFRDFWARKVFLYLPIVAGMGC
jgi:hypothetical protein